MDRAYSIVELKSVDEDLRVIRGMATTPSTDRVGDIIEPSGAKFAADIPLFLYHDSDLTVGRARLGKPTSAGIPFEASIPNVKEPGTLKDRVDEAWQMLKYRLITAVSIGFNPTGDIERLKSGGLRFMKTEILELSLVPIPANAEATITSVKHLDHKFDRTSVAASGIRSKGHLPGVSGESAHKGTTPRQKGTSMKTLTQLREDRTNKAARLQELVDLFKDDAHETSDEEGGEFDNLSIEVKKLDNDIRVAQFHQINAAAAKAVDGSSREAASQSRSSSIIVRKTDPEDKFPGQSFARIAIAKAIASKEQGIRPSDVASARWGKSNPNLVAWMKANEVPGGGTLPGDWGAELVTPMNYAGDFIEFLYGLTVFDKLALQEVPENILIKGQDGEATGYWVGEHKAIPATTGDFFNVALSAFDAAAIAVVSNKLLRLADPSAEIMVRNMLANAVAKRIDLTFLSADAAVAGVKPAGILAGLTPITASGTDASALLHDIARLYAPFIAASNASGLTLVTTPSLAKAISLMRNTLGQVEFPGLGSTGGVLSGDPVVVGNNIPAGQMILLKASDIYEIGDRGISVSISTDATIEQSTVPTGFTGAPPVAMSADMTSMFQTESTAIKVVRPISFAKRRASAVAFVSGADYGNYTAPAGP